jgi:hypothetical protein
MSVINKGVDLAILFLVVAYLVVPFAGQFVGAFFAENTSMPRIAGLGYGVVSGIVLILLIVFLFRQVKNR